MDIVKIKKFTWRIENFSTIKDEELYSETFIVDGTKWHVLIYPKGDNADHLSIYLEVADSENLPSGWSTYVQFAFVVINQIDRKTSSTKVSVNEFNAEEPTCGYPSFLALSELHNPERGYLVNDVCLVEAYVSTNGTEDLISYKLMVEAISGKHKIDEVGYANANEHEESNNSVVMEAFFTSLESKLLSSNIVVPRYEAKEAITKLDEALNMTQVNSYDSEIISSLKQAAMILGNSDFSSTMLTIEEKDELLDMEERLMQLANRARKAEQDKHYFIEMKWFKLMITCKLDRYLNKYKKGVSEIKMMLEEMFSMYAELEGIFESSKEMKTDLETLEKKCEEFESKAKIADEELKIVEAEWRRMKDFIYSIGEKIGKP